MSQDEENVCVAHCKVRTLRDNYADSFQAGKGRTGLMISCLLCYRYAEKGFDSDTALNFFAVRRTDNAKACKRKRKQTYMFRELLYARNNDL